MQYYLSKGIPALKCTMGFPAYGAGWTGNPTTQTVFSYDDLAWIAAKVAYIKANGLGGGYVWTVKDDDANVTLVKTLASGLSP